MDDLTKICDELEQCRKKRSCYSNRIVCTKAKLQRYIGQDSNKLMDLKAQIEIHNDDVNDIFGPCSFIVATFTLCVTILSYFKDGKPIQFLSYCSIGLMVILIFVELVGYLQYKYKYRRIWRKYIEIVLNDMEKDFLKKE